MLFKSLLGAQQSGSVGGFTASHNRGGAYYRERTTPVNPATPQQTVVRNNFASFANLWENTLTTAQRTAWDTYALQVPIINRIGDPVNIGGIAQYERTNLARLAAGLARIDVAPVIFNIGDFTTPTIASVTAPSALSLNFTNTDAWAIATGGAMSVLASRGQNVGINFFKGPYRFAGAILGDTATPPTSPAAITLPFVVTAGQRLFVQIRVTQADGRLSNTFRDFALSV